MEKLKELSVKYQDDIQASKAVLSIAIYGVIKMLEEHSCDNFAWGLSEAYDRFSNNYDKLTSEIFNSFTPEVKGKNKKV